MLHNPGFRYGYQSIFATMFPMFVASDFSFVHSLPMKKSFLFTFLLDNRGNWNWSCLSFAKVHRGIKEVHFVGFCCFKCTLPESTMYFVSRFIICLNERSRMLLIIAGD